MDRWKQEIKKTEERIEEKLNQKITNNGSVSNIKYVYFYHNGENNPIERQVNNFILEKNNQGVDIIIESQALFAEKLNYHTERHLSLFYREILI